MTRIVKTILLSLVVGLGLPAAGPEAADKVRVVTTIPDLKVPRPRRWAAISSRWTRCPRRTQNPHDLEVRPSLMVKLRRAELLIEQRRSSSTPWAEVVVQGANNSDIVPRRPRARRGLARRAGARGARPRAWTARWATSTRPATRTTRSTPAWRRRSSSNILDGLARVRPGAPRGFRAQPRGVPGPAGPGDGAAGCSSWSRCKGARVVVVPPRLHLLPDALRSRPGRRHRGPARHPALAAAPGYASSGR